MDQTLLEKDDYKFKSDGGYKVDLAVFQGPMDLLLFLIKKEEVDIDEIPVSKITQQYLQYIEMMQTLNLEIAGDYILMAATLIRIKTKLLLPRDEDNPDEVDPREELVMALMEYKKYKEAGDILKEKALLEERNYVPPSPVEKIKGRIDFEPATGLFDLLQAFKEVLESRSEETLHEVIPEEISIEDRIRFVLKTLRDKEFATFTELFADIPRKIVAVVTFIALLELARAKRVSMHQSGPFAELRIYRGTRFDDDTQTIDLIDYNEITREVAQEDG